MMRERIINITLGILIGVSTSFIFVLVNKEQKQSIQELQLTPISYGIISSFPPVLKASKAENYDTSKLLFNLFNKDSRQQLISKIHSTFSYHRPIVYEDLIAENENRKVFDTSYPNQGSEKLEVLLVQSRFGNIDDELDPESELRKLENSANAPLEVPKSDLPIEIPEEFRTGAPIVSTPKPESFPVIFRAFSKGTLSAEVTAMVLKIYRRMGERFRKGELLVQLDDTVFEGFHKKALGNLAKAKAELAAKEELYRENIASDYEVKTAQANVAVATSDLVNAEHAIKACFIRAPYDGKVVSLMIEEFELIQEGKPLLEIVNDDYLIGQVLVPAKLLKKLIVDKPVKVRVQETDTIEEGRILRVDAVIDPASSLIKVDIIVDNRLQRLRSGMIGRVMFDDEDQHYTPKEPYLIK